MGLTGMEMLYLADTFSTQKPQDCVVVGGGSQIQKLQDNDMVGGRIDSK